MSGARQRRTGILRHVVMTMAALAVVLKVLVPAGYMVGARTNENPFPIVLCTVQGMVEVQPGGVLPGQDHEGSELAHAAKDAPCIFGALGFAGTAQEAFDVRPSEIAVYQPFQPPADAKVSTPAEHTGPPLPARGPPTQLI